MNTSGSSREHLALGREFGGGGEMGALIPFKD